MLQQPPKTDELQPDAVLNPPPPIVEKLPIELLLAPPPTNEQPPVPKFLKPPPIVDKRPASTPPVGDAPNSPVVAFQLPPDVLCPIPPPIVAPNEQQSFVGEVILFQYPPAMVDIRAVIVCLPPPPIDE